MKIFQFKENKKQNFIDKILKKTPKENAIIEINNLFVKNEDNLTAVKLEDINLIADKYKVNINNKFKNLRIDLFRQYIIHCLQDLKIDEEEITTFQHLKKILYLTDLEIKQVIDFETKNIYHQHVKESVSNGILTDDEKTTLQKLKKNLLISDEDSENMIKSSSEIVLANFMNEALSDQRLSDNEITKMNQICNSLGIEAKFDNNTRQKFDKFRLYWLIENGNLPILNSPINIQKNEILHFIGNVKWLEQRTITKRINYGGPSARIKIAKGFYYTVGSVSAKRITEDIWQVIDTGKIYMTNKRIIFMGNKGNKTIQINKILDVAPYKNGVDIQKESGKSPFIEFSDNVDIFSMILVRLMNE